MIKLIVGLGNPGRQYEKTRHNAGFWFLEGLAHGKWLKDSRFSGCVAELQVSGHKVILLKPDTFMNRSGIAVGNLVRYYRLTPEEILVVHDELDLDVGRLRLKKGGGHAGHNGLRDIIEKLGSREFIRLRLGIGRPAGNIGVAEYVLSEPSKTDRQKMEVMFEELYAHLDMVVRGELSRAMNVLHA